MKFVDYKCPNCGGEVQLEHGAKSGKCINCGADVIVDKELVDKITRAFDLITQRKFSDAREVLNLILQSDVKNGEAYLGLLLCDVSVVSPDKLAHCLYSDYSDNPNYIRACQFLDDEKKKDLIQLCELNKQNLMSKKQNTESAVIETDLMKEFIKNNIVFEGYGMSGEYFDKMSVYGQFLCLDGDDNDDILHFFKKYSDNMENLIVINDKLSFDEKLNLKYYNELNFNVAKNRYIELKRILKLIKDSGIKLKEIEDNEYFDEESEEFVNKHDPDNINNVAEIEEDADEIEEDTDEIEETIVKTTGVLKSLLNDVDNNIKKKQQVIKIDNVELETIEDIDNRILAIKQEMKQACVELSKISFFDFTHKKETKAKISDLENEINKLELNKNLRQLEDLKQSLNFQLQKVDIEISARQGELRCLSIFDFQKRKEKKNDIKGLKEQRNYVLDLFSPKIKEVNMEIKQLKKKIKK